MKKNLANGRVSSVLCAAALAAAVLTAPGLALADDAAAGASTAGGLAAGTIAADDSASAASADSDAAAEPADQPASAKKAKSAVVAVANPNKYVATKAPTKTLTGHILLNTKYNIAPVTSVKKLSKLLGVSGSSVKVVSESKKGVNWKVQYNRGKDAYVIKNTRSGKVLAVSGLATSGSDVVQSKENANNKNQYWLATSTSSGYKFTPKANKKLALTVDGTGLEVSTSDNSADQRFWLFDPTGWSSKNVLKNGLYTLSPESSSSKMLAIKDDSAKSGVRAVLSASGASNDRVFRVTHVKSGYYELCSLSSGLALTSSGSKVVQKKYAKKDTQLWKASVSAAGNIVFVNKKTKRVLDGSGKNAATSKGKVSTAGASQRWELAPTASNFSPIEQKALGYANKYRGKVKTNWYLSIDMSTHRLVVFQRKSKNASWNIRKEVTVSTARKGRDVVANRLTTGRKKYTNGPDNYSAYYWTGLGWGSWTHSILYYPGTHTVKDSRLGYSISWGCVRMKDENAKWMQNHIEKGSGVSSYY